MLYMYFYEANNDDYYKRHFFCYQIKRLYVYLIVTVLQTRQENTLATTLDLPNYKYCSWALNYFLSLKGQYDPLL